MFERLIRGQIGKQEEKLGRFLAKYAKALCAFGVPTHVLELKMSKRLPHAFPPFCPSFPLRKRRTMRWQSSSKTCEARMI